MTLDQIIHALQVLRTVSGSPAVHYVNGWFVTGDQNNAPIS